MGKRRKLILGLATFVVMAGCGGEESGGAAGGGGAVLEYDAGKAVHGEFSGERAYEHVAAVVGFGARPPGSEALEKTRKYVEGELAKSGWEVRRQVFEDETPKGQMEFVNLRARFVGDGEGKADWDSPVGVLLGGHYDTKFYEDIEFVGANDAGSSTGGLIEAGTALAKNPEVARRVELVFFDGEECYVEYNESDGLYGSRYYAKELRRKGVASFPGAVVILDIIGDRELTIGMPSNGSKELLRRAGRAAVDLGFQAHFFPTGSPITDDHQPFHDLLRIPALDLIDMDYTPWHTSRDTLDKVSARSMEKVGQVALLLIEKYVLPDPIGLGK